MIYLGITSFRVLFYYLLCSLIIDMILFQGRTGSGVGMWLDTTGRSLISVLGNSEKSVSSADFFCRTVHALIRL